MTRRLGSLVCGASFLAKNQPRIVRTYLELARAGDPSTSADLHRFLFNRDSAIELARVARHGAHWQGAHATASCQQGGATPPLRC
jgi:hypothetical protein